MSRPLTLAQARARYVHRFTMEHMPAWARTKRDDGTYYAPQFRSDAEWYAATLFPGEDPELCPPRQKHCLTRNQTWPLGQALAAPFQRIMNQ